MKNLFGLAKELTKKELAKKEETTAVEHPLITEYKDIHQQYVNAMNNFDQADSKYIDVAIYEFNAKLQKMEVIIKQIREEGINYGSTINF